MALQTTSLRPSTKRCSSCEKVKEKVEFYKSDRYKDGHYSQCKVCQKHKSTVRYYLKQSNRVVDESHLNSFSSWEEKAMWIKNTFQVTSIKDDAISTLETKFGYKVSNLTRDRYLTEGGFTRSTLVPRVLKPNGRDDRRYTWDNGDYDDRLELEMMAQVQSELRFNYGLFFDKHHSVAQSKGGSYNVSNLRLIPSKLNKWIEQDHYTDEEITSLISVLSSADKNFQKYHWVKCLPVNEFIPLFVEHFTNQA